MADIMDFGSTPNFKYEAQSPPYQEHHQQLGGFHTGDPTTPTPTRNSSFPPESSAMAEARARNYQNNDNNDLQHNSSNRDHNSENQPEGGELDFGSTRLHNDFCLFFSF